MQKHNGIEHFNGSVRLRLLAQHGHLLIVSNVNFSSGYR